MTKEEQRQQILTIIGPRSLLVLDACYIQGKSVREIGKVLCITPSRVYQVRRKALWSILGICKPNIIRPGQRMPWAPAIWEFEKWAISIYRDLFPKGSNKWEGVPWK